MNQQNSKALEGVNIFDPKLLECPYDFYAAARRDAPVWRDPLTGIVQVFSHKMICDVARDNVTFSNRFGDALRAKGGGPPKEVIEVAMKGYPPVDTMLTADQPEHTRYRMLVNKAFSPKRVGEMEPAIEGIVDKLISAMAAKGEAELLTAFAQPLPLEVIATQLGVPTSDMPKFRRWSDSFVAQLSQMADLQGQVEAMKGIVEFQHYFAAKLAEKKAAPTNDIISDLTQVTLAEEGDPRGLTVPEQLSILQQLLVAGNETTASSIVEGMYFLIQHPDQMAAVIADHTLIPGLVEETLRMTAPTHNMWRVVTADTEIGGLPVKKGEMVLLRFGSGNRDDAQFPEAERFDVRRANARQHLSFGYGIHLCIGNALARKEMALAFKKLLTQLKNWRFVPGKNDFTHNPSILLRGMKALHVAFDRA